MWSNAWVKPPPITWRSHVGDRRTVAGKSYDLVTVLFGVGEIAELAPGPRPSEQCEFRAKTPWK